MGQATFPPSLTTCCSSTQQNQHESNRCLRNSSLKQLCLLILYIAVVIRTEITSSTVLMNLSILLGIVPLVFFLRMTMFKSNASFPMTILTRSLITTLFTLPYLVLLYLEQTQFNELYFVVLVIWNSQIHSSETSALSLCILILGSAAFIVAPKNNLYIELVVGSGLFSFLLNFEEQSTSSSTSEFSNQSKRGNSSIGEGVDGKSLRLIFVGSTIDTPKDIITSTHGLFEWKAIGGLPSESNYNQLFNGIDPAVYLIGLKTVSKRPVVFAKVLSDFIRSSQSQSISQQNHCKVLLGNPSRIAEVTLTRIEKKKVSESMGATLAKGIKDSDVLLEILFEFEDEQKQYFKNYLKFQKRIMRKAVEKALDAIQEIAAVTHENSAISPAATVALGGATSPSQKQKQQIIEQFRKIRHASQVAHFALKNAQDFMNCKYEISPSNFNFKSTIKELISGYQGICNAKGISLILIENKNNISGNNSSNNLSSRTIINDKSRIEQVLSILIDNSITAIGTNNEQGGRIIVKVRDSSKDSSCLTIEVDDSGPGVIDEFQPPFPQPKTLSQSFHNCSAPLRIGLFNLNKIISRIGPVQELALKSTKGLGTKMSFKIFRSIPIREESDKSVVVGGNSEPAGGNRSMTDISILKSFSHSRTPSNLGSQKHLSFTTPPQGFGDTEFQDQSSHQELNTFFQQGSRTHDQKSSGTPPNNNNNKYHPTSNSEKLKFRLLSTNNIINHHHSQSNTNINNISNANNSAGGGGGINYGGGSVSLTCMEDSLRSDAFVSVSKKKILFQTPHIQQRQSSPSTSQYGGQTQTDIQTRKEGRVKSVMIQEGVIFPPDTSSPKVNTNGPTDPSPKQKSILKRPKHVQQQQQQQQQMLQQSQVMLQNQSDKQINLSEGNNNNNNNEQQDLDGIVDEQVMLQMEEFLDFPEKTPQFVARKTQKQKKLSHLSDFSRMLTPQNMPSTTVFSNSRIGNDISPKLNSNNNVLRNTNRNSTFNFTEISKDF